MSKELLDFLWLNEQLNALEIIKTHKVNVWRLFEEDYVSRYNELENDNLTEEEFKLLKEVLCNE